MVSKTAPKRPQDPPRQRQLLNAAPKAPQDDSNDPQNPSRRPHLVCQPHSLRMSHTRCVSLFFTGASTIISNRFLNMSYTKYVFLSFIGASTTTSKHSKPFYTTFQRRRHANLIQCFTNPHLLFSIRLKSFPLNAFKMARRDVNSQTSPERNPNYAAPV